MIPIRRLERSIPDMAGAAVVVIAICSFVLSFVNLQAVAIEAGISPLLSWLWPVSIDMLLIAGSLMILRSSIRDESPLVGWSVLLSFTAVSTAFNVIHSPADLTAQAAHAVPPVSLCISIELLMMTIRSDLTGHDDRVDETPCTPDEAPVQQVGQTMNTPDQAPEPTNTAEMILHHFNKNPDSSISAAARTIGVSRSTVSRHLRTLSTAGMIQK